jgi:hypothetical protein
MSASPSFAATPHVEQTQVSAANTLRDGTGTVVTGFTTGTSGSRIERSRIKAVNTSTVNMIRWYLYDGTNTRLIRETQTVALTPSASVQSYEAYESWGLVLPVGWQLRVSVNTAEVYNIITEGADL